MERDKQILLSVADGPEGIEIYTSEDEGVCDWSQTFPAMYLTASVNDAYVKLGPFTLSSMAVGIKAIADAAQERDELQHLFDLQHTRTARADALWQHETGNEGVLPDLGTLIEWLLTKIKVLEEARNYERDLRIKLAPDACSICHGSKGGVPGNENTICGAAVCDYCLADSLRSDTGENT